MKPGTLQGRVALWTVAVVSGALIIFGAGTAWNLRRELIENLDREIKTEAADLLSELHEGRVDWSRRESFEAFLNEDAQHFQFAEVHDSAGRLLYRSAGLSDQPIAPDRRGDRGYGTDRGGHQVRFGMVDAQGLHFALGKDMEEVRETLASLAFSYLLTFPLVLLAVGAGAWWIAHRATAPVRLIAAQAEKISASDLHQRLPVTLPQDEIGHLSLVLNAMFDRLQRSFEQVTRFTSDASHELKTPLALMRAQLETELGAAETVPAQARLFSDLIEQCSQLSQIVDGLLFLSRADNRHLALEAGPVDLAALVQELREDGDILASGAEVSLQLDLPGELLVKGDVQLLRRAVMNLIDNAIKHNRAGGSVLLTLSGEKKNAVLLVRNTGAGIPAAAQNEVFERFYRGGFGQGVQTTGHGLGLSIAREIARAHGGDVSLVRSDGQWTEFRLCLPLHYAATNAPPQS